MNETKPGRKRMRKSSSTGNMSNENMEQNGSYMESPDSLKMDKILHEIALLRQEQTVTKELMNQKIDTLSDNILEQITKYIDAKFTVFRDDLNKTISIFDDRIVALERKVVDLSQQQTNDPFKDCERCVIANGVHFETNENLQDKISRILFDLGPDIVQNCTIVGTIRLNSRDSSKPPLVKIAFLTPEQKISVLRAKQNLSNSTEFNKVRIWGSKSHCERILEINCKMLLGMVPGGKNFRLTANGKLVPRENTTPQFGTSTEMSTSSQAQVPPYNFTNWPPLGPSQASTTGAIQPSINVASNHRMPKPSTVYQPSLQQTSQTTAQQQETVHPAITANYPRISKSSIQNQYRPAVVSPPAMQHQYRLAGVSPPAMQHQRQYRPTGVSPLAMQQQYRPACIPNMNSNQNQPQINVGPTQSSNVNSNVTQDIGTNHLGVITQP